jgi:hypothetical protein
MIWWMALPWATVPHQGVSLNIQSVILLTNPPKVTNLSASDVTSNAPLHLGNLSKTELSDAEDESDAIIDKPEAESQLMQQTEPAQKKRPLLENSETSLINYFISLFLWKKNATIYCIVPGNDDLPQSHNNNSSFFIIPNSKPCELGTGILHCYHP